MGTIDDEATLRLQERKKERMTTGGFQRKIGIRRKAEWSVVASGCTASLAMATFSVFSSVFSFRKDERDVL